MQLVYNLVDLVVNSIFVSMIVSLVVFAMLLIYKKIKGSELNHKFISFISIYYFASLLYVTVYRDGLFMNITHTINIIPFKVLFQSFQNMLYIDTIGAYVFLTYNILGNILWFVPFGYFLCCHCKGISLWRVLLFSFLCSLSIELLQYITYVGVSDIDDLILNTLGGVLGWFLYQRLHNRGGHDVN